VFYLGLVAAFVALAWAWGRRARRPVPSWLALGFVLANAAQLTVTLLAPNPLDRPPWPEQMALRPPAFPFFLLLVAWATSTLSLGRALAVIPAAPLSVARRRGSRGPPVGGSGASP
jgi:adenylate cyclase